MTPALAPEVAPAAELPKRTPLHIEKITKLEDIAKVIAKLNAQKPAGMQVQFEAKGENAEELKLASNFILNMPKDLKASVELLRTLLTGDPRKMNEDSFNKLLQKAKLEPSKMKDLIVSKSRTVDLSGKSGDALSLPADISKATQLSGQLADLLKDSFKYTNPPLVVVRAPDTPNGDPFLSSLGTWCKMHQDSGFTDPIQDAFNLLRATKDDFNPLTASDTSLLSVEQLIRLAEDSVQQTPPPPTPPPINTETPASINIQAATAEQRAVTPKVYFDVISMREVISTMPAADLEKFTALVEKDPSLIEARTGAIKADSSLVDISAKLAAQVAENIGVSLSAEARPALNTVVDFYFGYLRPFPDITETEPLSSLLGYLRDNPNWDVRMAKNETGLIIGACSGQLVEVPYVDGDFKIGWNEHTWVDKDSRRGGVGEELARLFKEHTASLGSIGVAIETDNPFLITRDPRAFNHADPAARGHFWTSTEDGLGQAMDPFQRFKFWGGQGFGVICAGDPPTPISYTQISMALGEVGSCETINLAFLPTSEKYANSMPKAMYVAALVALQNTIDENSSMYPEMVRTIKQIEDTPGDRLSFVKLTDPKINEVLERGRESKAEAPEKDLAYCNARLSGELSESERDVLSKSREYLIKSKSLEQ